MPRAKVDQARAKALFILGLDFPEIAAELKCTTLQAKSAVLAALAASRVAIDQAPARIMHLEQVDAMYRAVQAKALKGDTSSVQVALKLIETRERLLSEPTRVKDALSDALQKSLDDLDLTAADSALIESCRQVARQIDHAVAHGSSLEATKAMYLLPHLWNGLRELGATPAARAALAASMPKPAPPAEGGEQEGPIDLDTWKHKQRGGDAGT